MRIMSLSISGVGGIRELTLSFNSGFNAICGPNGIGKTTILKIIANAFSIGGSNLKRHARYEKGKYSIKFVDIKGSVKEKNHDVVEFEPQKKDSQSNVSDNTIYVMNFRESRIIEYINLSSIPKDENASKYNVGDLLEDGISVGNMKGWFDNRWLFSGHNNSLSDVQISNLDLAKRSFSILDSTVSFKTVDASSLDIILSSRNGDIYFEYLSAGYKSCVYLIMGLIKEIEFRFGKDTMSAEDFDGVVLIDEIDLHLHPTWQARLVEALKIIFPAAQFITTTHSPSVLQTLNRDEIIPLTQDEDGNITVKELNLTEYGLQGWSIEEILRDVMEMPETTSKLYEDTKEAFDAAIDKDDVETAKQSYKLLKKMLHPGSIVRQLIDIQAAGLGVEE